MQRGPAPKQMVGVRWHRRIVVRFWWTISAQKNPSVGKEGATLAWNLAWLECTGCTICLTIFDNIRWNVGPCVVWRCTGTWRNMLPIYLRTVGYAAFWRRRAGDITRLVVHEALGHYEPEHLQVLAFEQLEGRGKRCQPVVKPAATSQFFAPNHEQNNLMGINDLLGTNFTNTNFLYWTSMSLWFCGWNYLTQWCVLLCSSDLQPCHWQRAACKNLVSCKHECFGL